MEKSAYNLALSSVQFAWFMLNINRPIKKPPENFAKVVKLWERKNLSLADVLAQTGLKEATFYRRLRELRMERA